MPHSRDDSLMTLVGSDSDSETLTGSYTQEKKTRTKVVGEHDWQEATTTDSRAVCPALNAMANHNYLNRTGQQLTFPQVFNALCECYNLTYVLSFVLTLGGFLLVGLLPIGWNGWTKVELHDFGKKMGGSYHDRSDVKNRFLRLIAIGVEHNASLVHLNVAPYESHLTPSPFPTSSLASRFLPHKTLITDRDIAHERVRREEETDGGPLDAIHAEMARGEMAIILNVWRGDGKGVERDVLVDWLANERLDEGKERKKTGLLDVMKTSRGMKKEMERVREVLKVQ